MTDAVTPTRLCQCGCGDPVKRTFVRGHHMRLAGAHPPPRPVTDRIRDSRRVDPDTGCWLWTLSVDEDGYASIKVAGATRYAARVSYEAFIGPVPAGLVVHQTCRVRRCVCPEHLEAITRAEQVARGGSDPLLNFAAYYERRRAAENCPNGHPWDDENTRYVELPEGGQQRACRTCARDGARERRADPEFATVERARNRELYGDNVDHIRARKRDGNKARYAAARDAGRCTKGACGRPAAPDRAQCDEHLKEAAARTWGVKRYPLVDIYAERGLTSCWLCSAGFSDDDPMTHDHLIPRSLDGPNEPWNLAPAHRSCNIRRRNTPLGETVAIWHPDGLYGPIADVIAFALECASALPTEVSPAS